MGIGSSFRWCGYYRLVFFFFHFSAGNTLPNLFAFTPNLGARLGLSEHPDENRRVFGFTLTDQDNQDIEGVLAKSNGRRLITTIGDCGAEYR